MKLSVIILAAGEGKRFNSRRPKVLQEIGGKPMLAYVLDNARKLAASRIHLVVSNHAEAARSIFTDDDLHWHIQDERLGTAHAVQCAEAALGGSNTAILILYGDVPFVTIGTLRSLLATLDGADLAILTRTLPNPSGYGRIVRDDNGRLLRIVEQGDTTPETAAITEINTGIIAARGRCLPDLLKRIGSDNAQGEYYLTDCVELALQSGLNVTTTAATDDEAQGVNIPVELERAERLLQRMNADKLMAQGVILRDARRLDIRGEVSTGPNVEIDVNVVLEGRIELGDGVRIGANCVLRDVSLGDGTTVEPFSMIESSRTGRNCIIGPFARIRPQVELADRVKVGNFVEIKKSSIGGNSKINHLSYIGDSSIGYDVNVGAGTITCNYDGAQKHRTVIGDDVFIGSDTQIIAPVKIGDGATIGAGSTITRDAEANALTLSRSDQKTLRNWRRPANKEGK